MSAAPSPAPKRAIAFDADAVDRADAKLRALSAQFNNWMAEEVEKVQAARVAASKEGWSDAALGALFTASHDAKGLGTTYEYPFISEVAASLCRFIETDENKETARTRTTLIEAHVDAMRAAIRDNIRTLDHPVGRALAGELTRQVDSLGVAVMF